MRLNEPRDDTRHNQNVSQNYHLIEKQKSLILSKIQKINRKFRRCQKFTIVVILSWLLMNADSVRSRRTIGALMASRLVNKALTGADTRSNGLSTIDAITLMQAMNSNNRANDLDLLKTELELRRLPSQQLLRQYQGSTALSDRQLPVPVPVPVPTPQPIAIVAALVAFIAAVTAGLTPFAAFVAALAAAIAAILAVFTNMPQKKNKAAPLIKKLVIKKTVLPFVIPIPYKKKEKEIVYVHKVHKEHKYKHKGGYEHHHEESRKKYNVQKSNNSQDDTSDDYIDSKENIKVNPKLRSKKEKNHLDKIENLLKEQNQLQSLVDKVIDD